MTPTLHNMDHLSARDVATLVESAGWPSVTLVLDTTVADRMTQRDAARLSELVDEAGRRLAARSTPQRSDLMSGLRAVVRDAARKPTAHGIAVFVNRTVQRAYRLPGPVAAQAVVEETFRTRDLLQTLHRTPPHLLLVLEPTFAQLYRVYADTLLPLSEQGFPVQLAAPTQGWLPSGDDLLDDLIVTVDRALAAARDRYPAPVIVAGHPEPVTRLVRRSRNLHRLAGVLTGPELGTLPHLYLAARASLEEYLASRQDEALLLLEERLRDQSASVHGGIESAWREAAGPHVPEMLLVEAGYHFPAVVDSRGVRRLDWLRAPEAAPEGSHTDLVDDLIELVIERGGWVAFAADGALEAHGRVALVTKES
jgi:hypothetical protein